MKRLTQVLLSGMAMFAVAAMTACLPSQIIAQVVKQTKPISTPAAKRGYTISKETTYFTGPLKKDGTIDFVAAINEHFAKGVTHENNAARIIVPLLDRVIWGVEQQEHRNEVLESLGLDPAQHEGKEAYVEFATMLNDSKLNESEQNKPYLAGLERPWSEDEFPVLAKWLALNEEPLAKISEAARMDRHHVPLVVSGDSDSLVLILMPDVQAMRGLARAYVIRANNHLANQRWEQAWNDILTIKELGRLVGQGQTLIDGLVGVAITGMACQSATQFITTADPKDVDWQALQESWQTRPIAHVSKTLDVSERAMFIQLACNILDNPDQDGLSRELFGVENDDLASIVPNKLFVKTLRDMLKSGEVKLDEALRFANGMYDRAVAISKIPDAEDRRLAFEKLDNQLVNRPSADQAALLKGFFAKPEEPAQQFAKALLGMIFPSAHTANRAEWRIEASQHVVELALAARVIQSRTGDLPQSLRELEPLVKESTMVQPATGATIAFQSSDRGLLIYHWGSNQLDDGGIIDDERLSDWGIRIEK